jgi:hypothetical protein
MKKIFLFFMTYLFGLVALGQNGYIKLKNDSIRVGYLRSYVSFEDGHQGIELWRTKSDKKPLKIPKHDIDEYAIKKDTFRVLRNFKPFQDSKEYFEMVDAKLQARGKINLYVIENYKTTTTVTPTGGTMSYGFDLYVLEDIETGIIKGLPFKKEKLVESLIEFFPEKYVSKYTSVKGKITHKSVPDLVRLFNSK